MKKVFIGGYSVITSLGFTVKDNFDKLLKGESGIRVDHYPDLYPEPFPASRIDPEEFEHRAEGLKGYTPFERILILTLEDLFNKIQLDRSSPRTGIILSTTKGNIDLLKNDPEGFGRERIHLWKSAEMIKNYFGMAASPHVISNACISGVLAQITAARLLRMGTYDDIIVVGGDMLTEFVVAGFQSFMSLSARACRPFDKHREGLTLGEGAAAIHLTVNNEQELSPAIELLDGTSSNDANHISAPSRTGEGLYLVIKKLLENFPEEINYISAHGTATRYNDDMESVAIHRSHLETVPVNSFKGYIGHTLGAAGIIESVFSFESMKHDTIIKTAGFGTPGTVQKINITKENTHAPVINVLKLASGFGGGNAAVLFRKVV